MAAINGVGIGRSAPARAARAVDGRARKTGFHLDAPAGPAEAGELTATLGVALDGLLALQEAGTETVRDRAARRQGQVALTLLAKLQCEVLGAALAGDGAAGLADATMDRLAELAAASPGADDPRLTASLRAVAVRVAVELARRGR
jgi:hypothetical protein